MAEEEQGKKVLVTGAAGFIGSRLCEKLAEKGWTVLGIDNLNDYYDVRLKLARLQRLGFNQQDHEIRNAEDEYLKSDIYPSLFFSRVDITDKDRMERIFSTWKPDSLMNLAAQAGVRYSIENPYSYITNNIEGFLILLECARHYPLRRFVYASSSSVYGGNTKTPFSETDNVDDPVSLYAATKKSNEMMARAYRNLYGVPAVGLRFFTVYGPWGRPDMAPMLFASAITSDREIKVFNNGEMSRDFTYIDDIVDGIIKVLEGNGPLSKENDLYNIGHGSPVDLMEFIEVLENSLGKKAKKEFLPMQKGDVKTTFADTSKLEKDYGYKADTDLKEGVKAFADWYLSDLNPLRK